MGYGPETNRTLTTKDNCRPVVMAWSGPSNSPRAKGVVIRMSTRIPSIQLHYKFNSCTPLYPNPVSSPVAEGGFKSPKGQLIRDRSR